VKEQTPAAKIIGRRPYVDSTHGRVGMERWRLVHAAPMFRGRTPTKSHVSRARADVHNYDTIYQERYVGLPQTDSAASTTRRRSTCRRAQGDLLVVHAPATTMCISGARNSSSTKLVSLKKPFQMMRTRTERTASSRA